jgi:hypothetical protein
VPFDIEGCSDGTAASILRIVSGERLIYGPYHSFYVLHGFGFVEDAGIHPGKNTDHVFLKGDRGILPGQVFSPLSRRLLLR